MGFSQLLMEIFPGIGTFFAVEPMLALARIALIIIGFVLAYLGFKRTLEPLIMIPMGIGMICVNCGALFLDAGIVGNIFIDPLVSEAADVVDIMQINWLQPIYNLMFSNGLIACLIFMGIGVNSDISFLLAKPWTTMTIALFAELGTFVALVLGVSLFGLTPAESAAVATIGGADGPMVLFTSLSLSPDLFVPIGIIAYLYVSLTYAGYPYLIKLLVPKKYRGIDVEVYPPEVPAKTQFVFIVVVCALLCLLLPVAAPLICSFFVGVAIKAADVRPYVKLLEETIMYASTFFLGLLLGTLCEASTILNPTVAVILVLGVIALAVSGIGGLIGGWLFYKINKGAFNPVIGIAGVSCVPTTCKLAQHAAEEENPFAMLIPVAMGCNICGVITSAIIAGVFIATIPLL